MRKSFDPNDCIAALNNVKNALQQRGTPFSKEQLLEAFRGCGLPTTSKFFKVFKDSGIIQEISRGRYMFTSKEPIFVGTLVNIKHKYQEINKQRNQKYYTKKQQQLKEEPDDSIQSAIKLLKKHGYQILMPIGVLYKKL